ncbi:MAG TPA: diguanylate cyclase [Gammaproteobacteria bacterium]|nr:diguanylate cyclase [Gammaproteobacteria bacterium]
MLNEAVQNDTVQSPPSSAVTPPPAERASATGFLGKTSLRFRMRLINAIFVGGIVVVIVIMHQALQVQIEATNELVRLSEAEQYAEDADRLHDALRGDLYAALLAPRQNATKAEERMRTWQLEVNRFRDDLEHQSRLVLPSNIENDVNETRRRAEEFLVRTEDLMGAAANDGAQLLTLLPGFEAQFAELETTFDGLNTLLSEEMGAARSRAALARDRANRSILLAAAVIIVGTMLLAWTITRSIGRSVRDVSAVARALASGELHVRYTQEASHEVGEIGSALNAMANSLQQTLQQMRADATRDRFNKQVADAFETADSETDIGAVAARAMAAISAHPMELLLAESSQSELRRCAEHPTAGAPGCTVRTSAKCVAVRRGSSVTFADGNALNACPYLRQRASAAVSAVCVPLSFMGKSLGVLHATSSVEEPLDEVNTAELETLAQHVGTRLGTVTAFERTQRQALTDSMTGLPNRRALELEAAAHIKRGRDFALIIADLDHFKRLNDTYGHHTGDRALRVFGDALRACLRSGDCAARWGGEEFVVALLDANTVQALDWVQRVRARLVSECAKNEIEPFTSSFGIAASSMSPGLPALLRIADAALYVSKTGGRDRATVGTPDMALEGDDRPHPRSDETLKTLAL